MDYVLCYHDISSGKSAWECVSGEDAMHIRVSELCNSGIKPDDIMVFKQDDELDSKIQQDGEEPENGLKNHILEIIDKSLALAGFKILDGDRDSVCIRHSDTDSDFFIKVVELVN